MWAWAGVTVAALFVFSAVVVGAAFIVASRSAPVVPWLPVPSTNPVVEERLLFASVEARDGFEAAFWAAVRPLTASRVPVVPGDGGDPQWTA